MSVTAVSRSNSIAEQIVLANQQFALLYFVHYWNLSIIPIISKESCTIIIALKKLVYYCKYLYACYGNIYLLYSH